MTTHTVSRAAKRGACKTPGLVDLDGLTRSVGRGHLSLRDAVSALELINEARAERLACQPVTLGRSSDAYCPRRQQYGFASETPRSPVGTLMNAWKQRTRFGSGIDRSKPVTGPLQRLA
jgi:hypothetical protein